MGGRLSKEEIERMVNDAEKFKAEDDKQKERVSAKNELKSYCFNMKTTLDDEKVKDKISEDDMKTITDKCDEAISGWMLINSLKLMSLRTSRKRSRVYATLSSLNFIRMLVECRVVCQVECQVECLIWEIWEVVCRVELVVQVERAVQDLQLRRLTN